MVRGAWPFLVGGVICLVNSVNQRELSLFNSVKHDSRSITLQRDFVSKAFKPEAHMTQYQRRRRCIFSECLPASEQIMLNLVQKSCQAYSSVLYCMRWESGKETSWSQTLQNWSRWTHLKSTPEGSMLENCQRRWKVTNLYSQSQMEQSKSLEEIDVWVHPP